jgi:hypothetical protein
VLRLRANAFNLYDGNHEKVEVLSYFKDLGEHESGSVDLYYKLGEEYTLGTAVRDAQERGQ